MMFRRSASLLILSCVCHLQAVGEPPGEPPTVEHAWSMGDDRHLRVLFSEPMEPGAARCLDNYTMGPETSITGVRLVGPRCVEVTVDELPTDYRPRISMRGLTDNSPARNPLQNGSGVIVAHGDGLSYPMIPTPEGRLWNTNGGGGHAELQGGAKVEPTLGPFGGPALVLDGISGCALAPPGINLGDGDFTIMLWLNPDGKGTQTILAKNRDGWIKRGWSLFSDAADGSVSLRLNGDVCRTSPGAAPPGTWAHIAFVRRGGYAFAYVNGQPSGKRSSMDAAAGLGNAYPLWIGRGARDSAAHWPGKLARLRVATRAFALRRIRTEARTQGGSSSAAGDFRCLFGHGILKAATSHNTPEQFKSYIRELRYTDVDAVLYEPQMWRLPVFPSAVDTTWKGYKPGQPVSRFKPWDGVMTYLHQGGDPVKDTLEACRENGKAFFVSYRMNDRQHTDDLDWPTQPNFWRNHPECWLGRGKGERVHNYLLSQVREHTFGILEELCTDYDIDGLELDFQRSPRFFRDEEIAKGTPVMTGFVGRVRNMLDRLGRKRGKTLKLCVRVPHTIAGCEEVGLDVVGWDAASLIDMINVSPSRELTLELGIEEFKARTSRARIYGEMLHVTGERLQKESGKRYATPAIYRHAALDFWRRGVDGLSFYNFGHAPSDMLPTLFDALAGIAHVEYLDGVSGVRANGEERQ